MSHSVVIYHRNCPSGDGFTAAFAAWMSLGHNAEYVPRDYGDAPPDVVGKHVFILDLAFPAAVLHEMSQVAASLTLLDHHLTSQRALASFRPVCCGKIHFNLEKCGAVLAWEHFHPEKPLPALFRHIQDRDLWTWCDATSKPFLAWLDTQPKTFERWSEIMNFTSSELQAAVHDGNLLASQFSQLCASIASKPMKVRLNGVEGLMVNASGEFRSEVGMLLAQQSNTFGLVWRIAEDGSLLCSLRSVGLDVEQLALRFGGGGHPTAASFKLPTACVLDLVAGKLEPMAVPV